MSGVDEALVLCEGYWDRSFWKGWLQKLGCTQTPAAALAAAGHRSQGAHSWTSPTGLLIHVRPCHGVDAVKQEANLLLRALDRKPLRRLVINLDPDGTDGAALESLRDSVRNLVRRCGRAARQTPEGDHELDGGLTLSLVPWYVPAPVLEGVPTQQALEQLACAALAAVHGSWARSVHEWLAQRPEPQGPLAKAHAWSYMAGWYADRGCDAFYERLWDEVPVAAELERLLRASGAWRVAESLVK
jgi:hypothetical protein